MLRPSTAPLSEGEVDRLRELHPHARLVPLPCQRVIEIAVVVLEDDVVEVVNNGLVLRIAFCELVVIDQNASCGARTIS